MTKQQQTTNDEREQEEEKSEAIKITTSLMANKQQFKARHNAKHSAQRKGGKERGI